MRQRGREKRRQKKREEAQQALRPIPPPEGPFPEFATPLSFSEVPLPGPYIPTFPLAGSLSETHAVDREMPLETSEATDHIKYPKDETAGQGPKIEGDEVDGGLNTRDGDESDVSDYWDSYEKYNPDIPSPSDGERENGVNQSEQEIKHKQRAYEVSKIEEVQNAYKSLKAALEKANRRNRRPQISISDTHFRLYSTDYFDHSYNPEHYPSKYVKFYHYTDDHTKMNGHIILDSGFRFYSEPFSSPIYASPHGVNLTENDTNHDCDIKFLSNDYLILVLSRDSVFAPDDPPPEAPHYFTFFGVRFDKDKERVKRESRLMKSQLVEKKPSPSPNSSFESANPWLEYIKGIVFQGLAQKQS